MPTYTHTHNRVFTYIHRVGLLNSSQGHEYEFENLFKITMVTNYFTSQCLFTYGTAQPYTVYYIDIYNIHMYTHMGIRVRCVILRVLYYYYYY